MTIIIWQGGDDSDCECICNHSGACTGCGICWVKAYREEQERQIRALLRPPLASG